jgi:8-oxo-dGTP pyrophosphatase MutT (NUDIX family)
MRIFKHSHSFPILRSFFEDRYHRVRRLASTSVSALSLIWGAVNYPRFRITAAFVITSVVFLISGVTALMHVLEIRRWPKEVDDSTVVTLEPADPSRWLLDPSLKMSGYEVLKYGEKALVTSTLINAALTKGVDGRLSVNKSEYKLSGIHTAAREKLILTKRQTGALIFNGAKVRLCDDLHLENGMFARVRVERTDYFSTLVTNDAVNQEVYFTGRHSAIYSGRALCFPNSRIPALPISDASNQVGASTLAVTSDNFLVLMRSGARSAIAKGQLSSSGSGSSDWKDLTGDFGFRSFVRRTAVRELTEELGISPAKVTNFGIVGFGRFVDRGGKPEFFCLARLSASREAIKVDRPEREFMEIGSFHELAKKLPLGDALKRLAEELLLADVSKISSSLFWNLQLITIANSAVLTEILESKEFTN